MSAIAKDNTTLFNSKPPDNDAQRATLARELRVAQGFTLIFALCNSAAERARQISALREELSDLKLQEIPVRTQIPHLLDVLCMTLDDPLPDAVFIYGMENWIRSDTNPQSIPFLLNLNAARNHFIEACPCPLVIWIPYYLLRQITIGAPDFVSVRSGLYVFTTSSSDVGEAIQTLQMSGLTEVSGMLLDKKQQRLKELQELLTRVQSLPKESRSEKDEVSVLGQLATIYYVMGRYAEAEPLYKQALNILTKTLGLEHPNTQDVYRNLAKFIQERNK